MVDKIGDGKFSLCSFFDENELLTEVEVEVEYEDKYEGLVGDIIRVGVGGLLEPLYQLG
jgi:hypothetical protein